MSVMGRGTGDITSVGLLAPLFSHKPVLSFPLSFFFFFESLWLSKRAIYICREKKKKKSNDLVELNPECASLFYSSSLLSFFFFSSVSSATKEMIA